VADNTDTCVNDGCTGVRASGGEQCLAHLAPEELEAELDQLTDGVNLHGVPVSEGLLRSILDRLRGPDRSPRFAHADFSGCVFGKGADFSGCVFSEGVDFAGAKFGDSASFRDVRFLNDARFANATFGEGASFDRAVFEGDAYFSYARFGWGTTFGEAQFSKAARFTDATFGYPAFQTGVSFAYTSFALADFARATFYSGVSFDNTTFDSGVFYRSDFHGRAAFNWIGGTVSFNGAMFHADTSFQGAKLRACSFKSTTFEADLDFTRLQADVTFAKVTLKGYANFQESTLKSVWLYDTVFEGDASFWGCTFAEKARFGRDPRQPAQWKATSFARSVRFDNAQFPGEAQFDGVTVGHHLSFANCVFERERRLGPVLALDELSLDDAVFIQPADLNLVTDRLSLRRARFLAGANLWVGWAEVVLEKAYFGASSILSESAAFGGLDEALEAKLAPVPKEELAPDPLRSSRPRVLSMRWAGLEYLTLSSVDLAACRFAGAHDLDCLRLEGGSAFAPAPRNWRVTARQTIAEEHEWRTTNRTPLSAPGWSSRACELPDITDPGPGARDIAAIYRDLRKGREDNKAEPDAADFYYGEMEMRRLSAPARSVERVLLSAYWAVSGYGLRASRAVAALLVVLALGTVGFATVGFADMNRVEYRPVTSGAAGQPAVYQQVTVPAGRPGWGAAIDQSIDSSTALLRTDQSRPLTASGRAIEVTLRLLGPLLLGLAVLAVRGRIKR
jgi:uncharacterized protein YjbI with pentapeptide repeats